MTDSRYLMQIAQKSTCIEFEICQKPHEIWFTDDILHAGLPEGGRPLIVLLVRRSIVYMIWWSDVFSGPRSRAQNYAPVLPSCFVAISPGFLSNLNELWKLNFVASKINLMPVNNKSTFNPWPDFFDPRSSFTTYISCSCHKLRDKER